MAHLKLKRDEIQLSTSVQWWKFWICFAARPLIFVVLNCLLLRCFLSYGRRGALDEHALVELYRTNSTRNDVLYSEIAYSPMERLRYNELILSVWFLLNLCVLLAATRAVQKGIAEVDSVLSDPVSMSLDLHVHAQVSRKVDVALGRGPRPRNSIFVSLLALLTVLCAAVVFASSAVWCFSWLRKAETSCRRHGGIESALLSLGDVPIEIQGWVRGRGLPTTPVVHMVNNVEFMTDSSDVLLAQEPNGEKRIFSNVHNPRQFQSVAAGDAIQAERFCAVYTDSGTWQNTVLCVDSSDDFRNGMFRNVTLPRHCSHRIRLVETILWVDLGSCESKFDYDTMKLIDEHALYAMNVNGPLQLVRRANFSSDWELFGGLVTSKGKALCSSLLNSVGIASYVMVLLSSSFGLLVHGNMSVGVVPAFFAILQLLWYLDVHDDLIGMFRALVAGTAFLSLHGVPMAWPLDRDALVWILYSALAPLKVFRLRILWASEFMAYADMNKETAEWILRILLTTVVGVVLDHPALYIMGLVGCIGSTLLVLWTLLDPDYFILVLVALCATTIGYHLKLHGTCLAYYIKRAVMIAWAELMNPQTDNHEDESLL
jgi:hypothetical protein